MHLPDPFHKWIWKYILGFLTFENYSSNPKDLCPRQRSSSLLSSAGDAILCWAIHDFLWYFLGISAIFVAKDYLSPEYIQVSNLTFFSLRH